MNIEFREAQNQAEVDQAYDLAAKIFGPNYFSAWEVKQATQKIDPLKDLRDAIIAISEGEIVGFIRIVNRAVQVGETFLPVGGITSVCLHPRIQGKGFGRKLMERATERLKQRGDAISITFARRAVDGFYPKFGYVGLGCHPEMTVQIRPHHIFYPLKKDFEEADAEICCSAYTNTYSRIFMSFRRSQHWWTHFSVLLSRIAPYDFNLILNGKTAVGYFIAKEGQIIELASLYDGVKEAVLEGIIGYAAEKGQYLTLRLPLEHWAIKALKGVNHTLKVRHAWDGGHMVRIMNNSSFSAALYSYAILSGLKVQIQMETQNFIQVFSQSNVFPTWSSLDEF